MITESSIRAAVRRAGISGKSVIEIKDDGGRGEGRLALFVRSRKLRPGLTEASVTTDWYAVWWRDGARQTAKIGAYPATTLASARKKFREEFSVKISTGENPTGSRARRTRLGITVEDLFTAYVLHLKASGRPSWAFAERTLLGKSGASSALGRSTRACDVKAAAIRDHLADIHGRGSIVMANASRTYLHAVFRWAMKSANSYTSAVGLVDWGIEHNPVDAIPRDPDANRVGDRHLTPSELRALWIWLTPKKTATAPALRLIIATGQRVMEILGLRDDGSYDRAEKMLNWSKTKNGQPHCIPLPKQAVEALNALVPNKHGVYFPHSIRPQESVRMETLEKAIRTFCNDSGVPHFTPRDLRRTWKTLSGAAGISKEVRDRLQNHARGDISSKHYDRYDYLAEKRAAVAIWESYLDRIIGGEVH